MQRLETDYLVVGAGAMGMAFTDALVDHADVHVTLVDRRGGPGGHWRDAYPFVRLHQASQFYGVASTVLGDGTVQQEGPEAGLHERADLAQILAYFEDVLERRLVGSGAVMFLPGTEHHEHDGTHRLRSLATDEDVEVHVRRRVVDATWLAPTIPATSPAPFEVDGDARVVTPGELPDVADARRFVVVGSGKTATDVIVWLRSRGVDPDAIGWVRPRDPWMFNRAVVQPDAAITLDMATDLLQAAADATSLEDLFLRLEDVGILLRIDRDTFPTMAKTPTLAVWELDLLREVERVVRLGRIRRVTSTRVELDEGSFDLDGDVVVHAAAPGLSYPPLVPIWQPDRVRLQTSRTGAPCFNAALLGYVEATREDDDERNRLCPPNLYGNTLQSWARMQARGFVAAGRFGAEPDIAAWADGCALNPSRLTDEDRADPAIQRRLAGLSDVIGPGVAGLAHLAGEPLTG